jgi:hypothetical protein
VVLIVLAFAPIRVRIRRRRSGSSRSISISISGDTAAGIDCGLEGGYESSYTVASELFKEKNAVEDRNRRRKEIEEDKVSERSYERDEI